MNCRFCNEKLKHEFIDLINSPPSNAFLTKTQLNEAETYFPLKLFVCDHCFLVQIDEYKKADEIFSKEYIYFSSYSTTWLAHSKLYTDKMTSRFNLNKNSLVVEVASNDGYLLQYFKEKSIPVLGIEPTESTAKIAHSKGIESITEFFGEALAKQLLAQNKAADLLLGNNVLAHVPDINDFVTGLKILLKPNGVITMEFPHVVQLIENTQFDTIYHEHFSYLSFTTVSSIFESKGLEMFDVEELPTHGGSLRIYAKHKSDHTKERSKEVNTLLDKESKMGLTNLSYYKGFQTKVDQVKFDLLEFLVSQKKAGKKIAAYGAAAKGNTLLNYCGIKNDLIRFVVDASPFKQHKFLPGSHLEVLTEEDLKAYKPDFIIIFPWNIKDEIIEQLSYIREWNGKFVIPLPQLQII